LCRSKRWTVELRRYKVADERIDEDAEPGVGQGTETPALSVGGDSSVDHSTAHRQALKLLPVLEKAFRRRKRPVGKSWRMDETYIRVKGEWKYLPLLNSQI
jgi:hypothetical protein